VSDSDVDGIVHELFNEVSGGLASLEAKLDRVIALLERIEANTQ
jgi:hypothetical protein